MRLNRQQLATFLPNPEAIKAFEELLRNVGSTLPDSVDQVGMVADNAAAQAAAALTQMAEMMQLLALVLTEPALAAAAPEPEYLPPPPPDRGYFPMQWPTRNPRGDGSWADLWVPEQYTFADNVLSLRNQSRNGDGTLYGLAAICCLDAAGAERGAFGYSRNSAIQPAGYIPDIVYVEYGDPFAGDGNPSSLKMICTMAATSPYFPGTSFTCFENSARTGETWVRSRGNKPINLEGTVLVGNAFTPSANGKLQVREGTNEFVIGVKNAASKEWVWGVNNNTMYFRNATDAVNGIFLANGGRVLIGNAVDDGATKLQINGGGIKHSSTTLLATSVGLANGAGTAAGTLANAPTAGNPTKWVPINDNGTTRYIPAW